MCVCVCVCECVPLVLPLSFCTLSFLVTCPWEASVADLRLGSRRTDDSRGGVAATSAAISHTAGLISTFSVNTLPRSVSVS